MAGESLRVPLALPSWQELNRRVTALSGDLLLRVEQAEPKIAQLEAQMAALETQMAALAARVQTLEGHHP